MWFAYGTHCMDDKGVVGAIGSGSSSMSLLSWLGYGTIGVGCLLTALWWFQDKLLYFPAMPPGARTHFIAPAEVGLDAEEVFFRTRDGVRLQAWFFERPDSQGSPTVLFFHGNAGNISHRLHNVAGLYDHVKANVLIVSYRGFGKSEGSPTQQGLQLDAQASLDWLLQQQHRIDVNRIYVFGRSLGGAVAIHLAAKNQQTLRGMIVENTFTSIPDMVDHVMPLLSRVKFLCTSPWKSQDEVDKVAIPSLFISGDKDELVPPTMMQKLHRSSSSVHKELHLVENGTHMTCHLLPLYYDRIYDFIENVESKQ